MNAERVENKSRRGRMMDGDLKLLLEQILQAQKDQSNKMDGLGDKLSALSERITQNEGSMELRLTNIKNEVLTEADCRFVKKADIKNEIHAEGDERFVKKNEFESMFYCQQEKNEKKAWEKVDRAAKLGGLVKIWGGWLIAGTLLIASNADVIIKIFNK
jgi:hypothetical protein